MDTAQYENMSPAAPRSKVPSKIPAIYSRGLSEISESDHNTRASSYSTQDSEPTSLKHKPSNLPEPAPKRKTLAERAGEVGRSIPAPKFVSAHIKNTPAAGLRNLSASSSGSSRFTSSVSSRYPSNNSNLYGSVGHGTTRPPSSQSSYKHHGKNTFSASESRPAPAVANVLGGDARSPLDKRKGTKYISHSLRKNPDIVVRKQRTRQDAKSDSLYSSNTGQLLSNPFRDVSITSGMQNLSLKGEAAARSDLKSPDTPSYIPKPVPSVPPSPVDAPRCFAIPATPTKKNKKETTPRKSPEKIIPFLNKYTNTHVAWDTKSRLENMEQDMKQLYGLKEQIDAATSDRSNLQEQVTFQKLRINELETIRSQLSGTNESLRTTNSDLQNSNNELQTSNVKLRNDLDATKAQLHSANFELDASRRNHNFDVEDLRRKHRNEVEDLRDVSKREKDSGLREAQEETERLMKAHKDEVAKLEKRLNADLDDERLRRQEEVQKLAEELSRHKENAEQTGADRDREAQDAKNELLQVRAAADQEKSLNASLKEKLTESATYTATLESSMQAMKAKINFLESDSQAQSHAFGDLNKRMQEAITAAEEANAKLRVEETLRRKLHNQVQELKGNIRVFCRVRPTLESEADDTAKISYPDQGEDGKEVVVMGPEQKSSLGSVTTSKNGFSFDKVFSPASQNSEVFEEISQLVQSALDGYNVCIFCYGQTGSGKTYTMSSDDGMIPLAVNQIYATATSLSEKGWNYSMEGSFVEVYNENINDLLGKADDLDKKKHEIRHDNQKCKTTITDVNSMALDSPATLQSLLDRASKNRSVAATKANERSSRSHSIFILKLTGSNHITGEQSEGVLNLVDLAGSERLAHSGATGDRLKETQNINRSLSCLGDVIAALGQGKDGAHIPYRNSKLTYLLQHSLGGNSKTLMFVMISPLMPHLSETLTSLKFATKVHNTHIGTAKKQTRVRDT